MFDFDVVTGPSERAKIARPDTRRKQDLPQDVADRGQERGDALAAIEAPPALPK